MKSNKRDNSYYFDNIIVKELNIIGEKNLGIDIPDQSTQEWKVFANNLIVEYETERLTLVKDKETGGNFTKDKSESIINSKGKELKDEDVEILKNENGEICTEEHSIQYIRLLGDILLGGTGDSVRSNERDGDAYKELMTRVLRSW